MGLVRRQLPESEARKWLTARFLHPRVVPPAGNDWGTVHSLISLIAALYCKRSPQTEAS